MNTVTEVAQEYGVHPVLVGPWKKEILENAGALFDVKGGPKPGAAPGSCWDGNGCSLNELAGCLY
jgi:transposase-like protein